MGVKGLWSLLETVGQETNLETMENKILAIDVSIWLNQSIKGMRNGNEEKRANAHCLGLFNKICKLLFYKIKPIFVFDGAVPVLKKQRIDERNKKQIKNLEKIKQNTNKLLKSYLSQQLKKEIAFEDNIEEDSFQDQADFAFKTANLTSSKDLDIYQLPPLSQDVENSNDQISDSDYEVVSEFEHLQNEQNINIETEDFKSLPPSIRHEILTSMKEDNKRLSQKVHLPLDSNDFSSFQMDRLLVRSKLQAKIEEAEDDINKLITEKFSTENDCIDDAYEQRISQRLMSDENTHFILLKKKNKLSSKNQFLNPSIFKKNVQKKLHSSSAFKDIFEDISEFNFGKTDYIKEASLTSLKCTISEKFNPKPKMNNQKLLEAKAVNDQVIFAKMEKNQVKKAAKNEEKNKKKNEGDSESDSELFEDVEEIDINAMDHIYSSKNQLALDDRNIIEMKSKNLNTNFEISNSSYQIPNSEQIVDSREKNKFNQEKMIEFSSSIILKTDESDIKKELTISKLPFKKPQSNEPLQLSQPCTSSYESSISQTSSTERETTLPTPKSLSLILNQPTKSSKIKKNIKDFVQLSNHEKVLIEREMNKIERQSSTVMQSMIQDCQELLALFGIPYLISPMEAEAQCAALERLGLTNGTITDDSDVWLFGGSIVYKNFFNQSKYVKMFNINDIKNKLSLNRELMICFALITGSDYTQGLEGAGPVMAMEILSEFEGEGIEKLKNFKDWWSFKKEKGDKIPGNKTRASFLKLKLNTAFPNNIVYNAYINPLVDDSKKSFSWGIPDLDLLRQYAFQKFSWNKSKVDDILLPVMKKVNEASTQTKIDSYFKRNAKADQKIFISKRLTKALDKFKKDKESSSPEIKQQLKKKLKKALMTHSKTQRRKSFQNKVKVDIVLSEDSSETDQFVN